MITLQEYGGIVYRGERHWIYIFCNPLGTPYQRTSPIVLQTNPHDSMNNPHRYEYLAAYWPSTFSDAMRFFYAVDWTFEIRTAPLLARRPDHHSMLDFFLLATQCGSVWNLKTPAQRSDGCFSPCCLLRWRSTGSIWNSKSVPLLAGRPDQFEIRNWYTVLQLLLLEDVRTIHNVSFCLRMDPLKV